jgi:GNAT superfamily N-acetyltransferase
MTIEVRRATVEEVRSLRKAVLRPNSPAGPVGYDLDPATVHIAAVDEGAVVGCATVFPDPYADEPRAWRLRGMAVTPGRQGQGIGRAVLEAATAVAVAAGAPLLWANGRVSALDFYESLGWKPTGPVFPYGPDSIDHRVILRPLP